MIPHDNLEEFQDPENYDREEAENARGPAAFYGELASQLGGAVLEIGCGTGLVAIPIAERGLSVTGSDICPPMLEHARRKAQARGLPIKWVESDARKLALGKQFSLIYLTGNAFQAFLRRDDQERLLAVVRRHLLPDGIFAFETRNPFGTDLSDTERRRWFTYENVDGQVVTVYGSQTFDALNQIMHWTTEREWMEGDRARCKTTRIACRFTYPQELLALLRYNRFRIVSQFGGWEKQRLSASSEEIITLCRIG